MNERRQAERWVPGLLFDHQINTYFERLEHGGIVRNGREWAPLFASDGGRVFTRPPELMWGVRPVNRHHVAGLQGPRIELVLAPLPNAQQPLFFYADDGQVWIVTGELVSKVGRRTYWSSDDNTGRPQPLNRDQTWRFLSWLEEVEPLII